MPCKQSSSYVSKELSEPTRTPSASNPSSRTLYSNNPLSISHFHCLFPPSSFRKISSIISMIWRVTFDTSGDATLPTGLAVGTGGPVAPGGTIGTSVVGMKPALGAVPGGIEAAGSVASGGGAVDAHSNVELEGAAVGVAVGASSV